MGENTRRGAYTYGRWAGGQGLVLHLRVAVCGRRRARSRSLCVAYTLDECRVVFFTRFFSSFWFVSLFFSTPRNPHLHLPHPSIYSTIIIAATKTFIRSHNRTISYSYLPLPLRVTNEPTNPRSVPILYLLFLSWPLVITIIYWVVRITAVHLFFSFRNVLFNSIYGRFT